MKPVNYHLAFGLLLLISLYASAAPLTFSYDALGRMTAFTLPSGSEISYIYDANGNRKQEKVVLNPASDPEKDGVASGVDNCPVDVNPTQADYNTDATGDDCDKVLLKKETPVKSTVAVVSPGLTASEQKTVSRNTTITILEDPVLDGQLYDAQDNATTTHDLALTYLYEAASDPAHPDYALLPGISDAVDYYMTARVKQQVATAGCAASGGKALKKQCYNSENFYGFGGTKVIYPFAGDGSHVEDFQSYRSIVRQVRLDAQKRAVTLGVDMFLPAANPATDFDFIVSRMYLDGTMDTGFGNAGIVRMEIDTFEYPNTLEVLSDGRILAGGSHRSATGKNGWVVFRLLSNGTLDSTFGTGGLWKHKFTDQYDNLFTMKVLSDGKILLSGMADIEVVLMRLTANGAPDESFGTNGIAYQHNIGAGIDWLQDLHVRADGTIYGVGRQGDNALIVRFNANGTIDTGFGTDGYVIQKLVANTTKNYWVQMTTDATGFYTVGTGGGNMVVGRYSWDGALDPAFGSGGLFIHDAGTANDVAQQMVVQTDGKLVVVGNGTDYAAGSATQVVGAKQIRLRLHTNGSLDSTYGSGGAVTDSSTVIHGLNGAWRQGDGKVLGGGVCAEKFCLQRYRTDGSLDATP